MSTDCPWGGSLLLVIEIESSEDLEEIKANEDSREIESCKGIEHI